MQDSDQGKESVAGGNYVLVRVVVPTGSEKVENNEDFIFVALSGTRNCSDSGFGVCRRGRGSVGHFCTGGAAETLRLFLPLAGGPGLDCPLLVGPERRLLPPCGPPPVTSPSAHHRQAPPTDPNRPRITWTSTATTSSCTSVGIRRAESPPSRTSS